MDFGERKKRRKVDKNIGPLPSVPGEERLTGIKCGGGLKKKEQKLKDRQTVYGGGKGKERQKSRMRMYGGRNTCLFILAVHFGHGA